MRPEAHGAWRNLALIPCSPCLNLDISVSRKNSRGIALVQGPTVVTEAERLSALIGDIYDTALDPALWISVLDKAARFVGGTAASLYSKDIVRKTGNVA